MTTKERQTFIEWRSSAAAEAAAAKPVRAGIPNCAPSILYILFCLLEYIRRRKKPLETEECCRPLPSSACLSIYMYIYYINFKVRQQ